MKLTPLDIKKQEFKKTVRGYDRIEVETFLEMVAEEFESLIREKNALADETLKLKTQLQDYQNVERTLQDTLVTAQESMKASRETSEREADSIMNDAKIKAERILEESKLKLANLKNELLVIKAQKDSIARRLKHLLNSQIELIEVLEMDDLGFGQYESGELDDLVGNNKPEDTVQFDGVDEVLPNLNSSFTHEGPDSQADQARLENEDEQPQPSDPQKEKLRESSPKEEDPNRPAADHQDGGKSSITDHLILD
ncbi:DivIVA domain-containing protein [bacterium]|nr:DivIVA domain-containing protein [bacterium]